MKKNTLILALTALGLISVAEAGHHKNSSHSHVADKVIAEQNANLVSNTKGKGFGPQSPRNIDSTAGTNEVLFGTAPSSKNMNLCNIHFHKNAEHAGGEFSKYAGNGDGKGFQTGYVYSGTLTATEKMPVKSKVCPSKHGALQSGDTIELHYVHSTAQVSPGVTLGACLSDSIKNPQLRVETQVYVLVNDRNALDFADLTANGEKNGYQQALNIPTNTGRPVLYAGSTTGPSYNETGSPFQVTWSVRPKIAKVNIETVGKWCESNIYNEDHAHGVRNLVTIPALLSEIN
ncbi:hypothetical protein L0668_17970 [Paraglaciecola aquimarina]|uniref:Cadmium carbonic anhydrase n=1 Tax=Paraglaciecola algarum TaxID=3050085 RepID=A0ABS9DAL9_9ALTE|nr:delta-class carbonic anhydrase [Paraglaciecola sp. G1-23]MCF2950011.1 hypothetical protein [Paraglaciecola sp. G1-23]